MRHTTYAAAAVLMMLALACSPRDRRETASTTDTVATDVGQETENAARDVKEDVKETVAGDYSYDRRDEFKRDIEERVNRLDQEIADLEKTTRKDAEKARDTAVVHIRAARRTVARQLDRLAATTENTWDDVRGSISRSVDSLDLLVRAQRPDAKPMGGTGPS
jgi:hypothetical protein